MLSSSFDPGAELLTREDNTDALYISANFHYLFAMIIDELLDRHPLVTDMMHKPQVKLVLEQLQGTLEQQVEGDVVELGCNQGTTSLFIQRLLQHNRSKKSFHVYDSFEGLPAPTHQDKSRTDRQFVKGQCTSTKDALLQNFDAAKLPHPFVHAGRFDQIPLDQFPERVSFAFFDGDFYQSILDSFEKVYSRLSRNAVVCIHDYNWEVLPGVKKACDEFLADKPEKMIDSGIAIGIMVKC